MISRVPFQRRQISWPAFLWQCLLIFFFAITGGECSIYFFQVIQPPNLKYTYETRLARNFGLDFSGFYKEVRLALALPSHSCSTLQNPQDVLGSVVMVERGGCSFLSKTLQAEEAGAYAVIVTDVEKGDDVMIEMVTDETGRKATIPALYLPGNHGRILRKHFLYEQTPIIINIPLNLTNTPLEQVRKPPWDLW